MRGQLSLFPEPPRLGSQVEHPGRRLSFEELFRAPGRLVAWDLSTESLRDLRLARVSAAWVDCCGERGITLDFGRRLGTAREWSFRARHACRAYAYEMEEDA